MKAILSGSLIIAAFAASGCADDAGAPGDDPGGGTGTAASAVAVDYEDFTWRQGDNYYFMRPTQTHFCSLASVAGDLRGEAESVTVDTWGGYWTLHGTSQRTGVAATARCIPLSRFNRPSLSASLAGSLSPSRCRWGFACAQPPAQPTRDLTHDDRHFCALTSISGQFDGAGEQVQIDRYGLKWNGPWLAGTPGLNGLGIYMRHGGDQTIRASAFCVGIPNSVKYLQRDLRTTSSAPMVWAQGSSSIVLARADQAACFLVGVGGRFRGFNQVQISQEGGNWVLGGEFGQGDNLKAEANCVAFDQSP